MKRTIAILMAVLMLATLFTACSGTLGMDDGRAYGNVSTTPNGYVNGGEYSDYSGNRNNGYANNSYRNNSAYGNNYGSNNAGTGMTGGR